MPTKQHHLFAIAATALALGFAATAADATGVFTLKSSTFQDGKMMPKNAGNNQINRPGNANCVGDNVSPQLSWTNVPGGTKSFIIFVIDLEGRGGAGLDQWVGYGIPASVTSLAKGEASKVSDKFVAGKSITGNGLYSGPCAPPNTTPHHYNFVLIATDFDPKDLPPGLTSREVQDKLPPSHSKGTTSLVGLYVNPWHR